MWAYVPSPTADKLPPLAEQDVIRTAFIYKPADVALVGSSTVLTGDSDAGQPFSIAREPLAQGFKKAGATDARHGIRRAMRGSARNTGRSIRQ